MKNHSTVFRIPFLASSLLMLLSPFSSAEQSGDFTYRKDGRSITITGYTGPGGNLIIPAEINRQPVTAIGDKAFFQNTVITGIVLPDGLTHIGSYSFSGCPGLTSVSLPARLDVIGPSAFERSSKLTGITLPPSLTKLGTLAFYLTSLTNVTIPANVASIGTGPFGSCRNLTAIDVDAANLNYVNVDGILFDKARTTLIQYPPGKAGGSYAIPSGITRIETDAFAGCSGLTDVTIPDGVASIGNYTFTACSNLTSLTFPASLTRIGLRAFDGCNGLKSVIFSGNAPAMDGNPFQDVPEGLVFHHYRGKTGFTSPKWNDRPVVALAGSPAPALLDWTSTDGKTITAKFVKLSGDAVVIEKEDGSQFTIPFAKLAPASIKQAKRLSAAEP